MLIVIIKIFNINFKKINKNYNKMSVVNYDKF